MTTRFIRQLATAPFIGAAAMAAPAHAADWLVYTSAQAGAYPTPGVTDVKCSGTRASSGYCGSNAQVVPNQFALTSDASATNTANYANFPSYQHGDGYASADLATGKLRIADHAISQGFYRGEGTYGSAAAQFQDALTFSTIGNAPFSVVVKLHVDGIFDGYQQPRFSFNMSNGFSYLAGTAGWSDASDGIPSCIGTPSPACTQQPYFLSFNVSPGWTQFGPSDFIGTLMVDSLHPTFSLAMALSAGDGTDDNGGGVTETFSEFGHTASVQFDLPQGVSFTSASGAFLTSRDTTAAVPETATWSMMISGFGLIGGAMRRRSRTNAKETGACA